MTKPQFVTVPVARIVSRVSKVSNAIRVAAGREPLAPIQQDIGQETHQLRWVRGGVKPDGTPFIKS